MQNDSEEYLKFRWYLVQYNYAITNSEVREIAKARKKLQLTVKSKSSLITVLSVCYENVVETYKCCKLVKQIYETLKHKNCSRWR